jgi:hypothetical protein
MSFERVLLFTVWLAWVMDWAAPQGVAQHVVAAQVCRVVAAAE